MKQYAKSLDKDLYEMYKDRKIITQESTLKTSLIECENIIDTVGIITIYQSLFEGTSFTSDWFYTKEESLKDLKDKYELLNKVKKVRAHSAVVISVECPYCKEINDMGDYAIEYHHLDSNLNWKNCNIDVKCYRCSEDFIVEHISYI